MTSISIDSKVIGDIAILYPRGYLNNLAGETLESACNDYLSKGINKIVLNFGSTEFINSIGISILLAIMDRMREIKGSLCFSNMGSTHEKTFRVLGLKDHMKAFKSEDEALRHLQKESAS